MPRWQVTYDPKLDVPRISVSPGFGHALLAPVLASVFQELRVPASLWEHGDQWFALHTAPANSTGRMALKPENGYGARDVACL